MKLHFWSLSLSYYRKEHAEQLKGERRPRPGNPSLRPKCCNLRPAQYPDHKELSAIPELAAVAVPAGIAWGGYIKYFDCKVCGQAWIEDWEPCSHGGVRRIKKV